ncbi:hypothetical protein WG68_00570 [Arsukibacterium ikkense]|uniref:Type II secretion system protein H n=2 Tax=Arsukibacterium ikkense TaxID=336831 RepID=A0A0M2V9A4_9GAMM|nr:hypothetical protein WG68_00570 [Arsukibacterium ikkense]
MAALGGFTLIELMVTVAVLAIVLTVAVPSFANLVNSNRLSAQANDMLAGLILARTEAIKQNQSMLFCHTTDGENCSVPPAAGWQGWLVRGTVDTAPVATSVMLSANLRVLSSANVANATVDATGHSIRFNPQGLVRSGNANNALNGVLRICLPDNQINPNSRDIELRSGGRTRVVSNNVAVNCPTPADPA